MITAAEIQETLRDLITQYGPPNASNTQMYSAVLKSALANDPREAGLIDISLDKQIPGRLYAQKNNPQIIDQLVQELISSHRIDSHAAEWIVKTWAKSMGMNVAPYQPPAKQQFHQQATKPPVSVPNYQHSKTENQSFQYKEPEVQNDYGSQNYQQSPTPVRENNYYSQGDQGQMLCPQCRTPLPREIGARCTRCGYTATKYGGFLRRFCAYLIDTIVIGIIYAIFALFALGSMSMDSSGISMVVILIVVVIIMLIYFPIFESSQYQGTPGKIALGLKVVDENFVKISVGKAVIRYLGRIVCGLTLSIGYLLILFTDKKQGLHDKIAGTFVIHK